MPSNDHNKIKPCFAAFLPQIFHQILRQIVVSVFPLGLINNRALVEFLNVPDTIINRPGS